MARRGNEYLLARRIADRGNDENVFYSRARGEDRRPTRRTADRGSDEVYPDPRDLKIKRLRQRVQDLERQQEINRLRQRVQDLELQKKARLEETESGIIFRDDENEEEYPSFHSYYGFYEPTYFKGVPQDEPKFDENPVYDREEFNSDDEKGIDSFWSSLDRCGSDEALGLKEKSLNQEIMGYTKASESIFGEFVRVNRVVGGGSNAIDGGSIMVMEGGLTNVDGSAHLADIITKRIKSTLKENLNSSLIIMEENNFGDFVTKVSDLKKDNIQIGGGINMQHSHVHEDISLKLGEDMKLSDVVVYLKRLSPKAHVRRKHGEVLVFNNSLYAFKNTRPFNQVNKIENTGNNFFDVLKTRGRVFFEEEENDAGASGLGLGMTQ